MLVFSFLKKLLEYIYVKAKYAYIDLLIQHYGFVISWRNTKTLKILKIFEYLCDAIGETNFDD